VDHGHGQREATGHALGRLTQPYLHFAFAKGLDHWFAKHAVYARREAEQVLSAAGGGALRDLFRADAVRRRRALKALAGRLPGRYFFRLAYMMLVRWAFLDGTAGVTYAHMLATYEAMVEAHLRLSRHGLTP
jgi:hypothetical protein